MFVELSDRVLVDPNEVVMITGSGSASTRVYLAGAGPRYVVVERPFEEVVALIKDGRKLAIIPPP